MQVDNATLEAIVRLSSDPDFRKFMDEVSRRREAARERLEVATDMWSAGQLQGESRFATELIRLVKEARESLRSRDSQQAASRFIG